MLIYITAHISIYSNKQFVIYLINKTSGIVENVFIVHLQHYVFPNLYFLYFLALCCVVLILLPARFY